MSVYLSKKDMADLLVTAWEGGSNYWVEVAEYKAPKGTKWDDLHKLAWEALPPEEREFWKKREGVPFYAMMAYLPPSVKWKVKFTPNEVVEKEGEAYYLTPENMRKASAKLAEKYPHIFARIKDENYDAGDADAWLQMAIFGDVIFG